jgi:type II secretory pathway pseudopilin PulG
MKKRIPAPRRRHRQNGYALLLVIFLTMMVTLGTIVAAPAVRTERQREKEQEMIWRGKQYIRGIKLYYRKNGRFPTSLDDLTKPKNGSLRYLRQAYKDPMSKEDGSWRLIYVGPSGQLIGSLKPPQTLQFSGAGGPQGTPAAGAGLPGFGQQSQQGAQQGATPGPGQPGQSTTGLAPLSPIGTTPGAPGATGTAQTGGAGPGDSGSMSTPTSLSPSDSPLSIIGGNIIGVGSKRDKASIIIYEKAKNYHLFEFIWDPSKDTMAIGGTGTQVGTPNAPGQGIGGPGQGFGQPAGQGPGQGFGGQGGFGTQPGNNPMQPTTPPLSTPPQQP